MKIEPCSPKAPPKTEMYPLTLDDVKSTEGIYQCNTNPSDYLITVKHGSEAPITFSYYTYDQHLSSHADWYGKFRRLDGVTLCMEVKAKQ